MRLNAPHERTVLHGIMLIAVWLRAHMVLQIEHNVDHAYPVWQALQTLDHGVLPLVGQKTSILFANPPLTGYLFLPLVALLRLPLAPYLLTIPLNTLGVLLAYRTLRTLMTRRLALVGAFLMAVNPWVIEYSRTSWVQSLLPFFICALTWALFPVLLGCAKHPARRTLLAAVILTALANTYLLAYIVVIPVSLLMLIFRRRTPWRSVLIGAVMFCAAAAPYLSGVMAQGDPLGQFNASLMQPAHLSAEAWSHALRLISGKDYAAARGVDAPIQDAALRQSLSEAAHMALAALVVIGIAVCIVRVLRKSDPTALILLLWFLLPVALMTFVGLPVHPFYLLVGIPAGYGIAALGLSALMDGLRRLDASVSVWGWRAVGVLLALFGVLMALNSSRYYEETAVIPGAHGLTALPLTAALQIGADVRTRLPPDGIVYSDLDNPYILSSFAGEIIDQAAYSPRIYPAQPALRLRVNDDPRHFAYTLDPLPSVADINESRLTLLTLPSDRGISLMGYRIDISDNVLHVDTYWRVDARLDGVDGWTFGGFAHVFDASGTRIAILDDGVIPGSWWRVGDVHRYSVALSGAAADAHWVEIGVGLYDPIQHSNAIFVMPDGEYTAVIPLYARP